MKIMHQKKQRESQIIKMSRNKYVSSDLRKIECRIKKNPDPVILQGNIHNSFFLDIWIQSNSTQIHNSVLDMVLILDGKLEMVVHV